jgi:hypothetical protein
MGKGDRLGDRMSRFDVLHIIKRRAEAAGPLFHLLPYLWTTGITTYLQNGGTLEHAQTIANHESAPNDQAIRSHPRGTLVRGSRERQHLNRCLMLLPARADGLRVNVLYIGAGNTREGRPAGPRVQMDSPAAEQSRATIEWSTISVLLSFWNIPNQCQNSEKLFG